MPRGGAREGAGRHKGAASRFNDEARAKAAEGGIMPLDYLLSLLRDTGQDQEVRVDVAKAAAPYLHARLNAVQVGGDQENPLEMIHKVVREIVDPKDTNGEGVQTAPVAGEV